MPGRWAVGDRFVTERRDRELEQVTRLAGVVLEVDELLAGARVRLDGSCHVTWLALEMLERAS